MKDIQMPRIALLFVCMFVFTSIIGCGRTGVRTIQGPMDISNYNKIYVADADVSSREQTDEHRDLNVKYSQFAKDEMVKALEQKSRFRILENIGSSPDTLTIESKIDIVYGSRALRYSVGFGAGSGSIIFNIKLKAISSGEVKLEIESHADLSMGAFGGSIEGVIQDNIKKTVSEFAAKL